MAFCTWPSPILESWSKFGEAALEMLLSLFVKVLKTLTALVGLGYRNLTRIGSRLVRSPKVYSADIDFALCEIAY